MKRHDFLLLAAVLAAHTEGLDERTRQAIGRYIADAYQEAYPLVFERELFLREAQIPNEPQ